jgi:putative tributyrin esterase
MNYFNYITEELPKLCRETFKMLSDKREDNLIAGLSMGGYGALKIALTYPERYSRCISLSGALDVTRKGRPSYINEWRSIFGFDLESPMELEGSEHDLFALSGKLAERNGEFPKLYLWCGLEDSLLGINRDFDRHLNDLGVEHFYAESEGNHSWKWWDLHIQNGLRWALED